MRGHDFDTGILRVVAHRPWPMPAGPWIMTQTWHDVLFAHWTCDARALAALVPAPLEIDTYDGEAWLGVVPFRMTNVAPRGVPALPGVSAFPEVNLRTYVRARGRPGVYFFSLDAGSRLAVLAARTLFGLPYFAAAMQVQDMNGAIRYRSRRLVGRGSPPADIDAVYGPAGATFHPRPDTLEAFLTERYCLHTVGGRSGIRTVEIHHPPWPLQPAGADLDAVSLVAAARIRLPPRAPILHYARRQDVVVWPPHAATER